MTRRHILDLTLVMSLALPVSFISIGLKGANTQSKKLSIKEKVVLIVSAAIIAAAAIGMGTAAINKSMPHYNNFERDLYEAKPEVSPIDGSVQLSSQFQQKWHKELQTDRGQQILKNYAAQAMLLKSQANMEYSQFDVQLNKQHTLVGLKKFISTPPWRVFAETELGKQLIKRWYINEINDLQKEINIIELKSRSPLAAQFQYGITLKSGVNYIHPLTKQTPLTEAIRSNMPLDIIKRIHGLGANLEKENGHGQNAFSVVQEMLRNNPPPPGPSVNNPDIENLKAIRTYLTSNEAQQANAVDILKEISSYPPEDLTINI